MFRFGIVVFSIFDVQFKGRNREGVWFGSWSFAYLKSGQGWSLVWYNCGSAILMWGTLHVN